MGIMSKRIAAKYINIGSDGRNRGEIDYIFELDSKKLILREVKALHTKINRTFDLTNCETDLFLSTDATASGLGSAVAGGLLFGGAGAVVGAIVGKGNPSWIFELKTNDEILLFRLKGETDKKILEKYLAKY